MIPTPGPSSLAKSASFGRLFGQSICSIDLSNVSSRAATDGLGLNGPTELFCRNGAVDQRLTSDAGRAYPRPPAGRTYGISLPVTGWRIVIVPADGSVLYDSDEKLSQMLFR